MKKNKSFKRIISLIITIIFTVLVLYKIDFVAMKETFQLFDIRFLFFLLPFFVLIMFLRIKRWNILLPKHNCSFYTLYEIYMASNLINIFLPARAGDIFRGCYFGHKYNLSKINILGTIAAERILDGLTVILILVCGIILYNRSEFAVQLAITAGVIFVFSFLFMLWVYKYNKIDEVCNFVKNNASFLPEKIRQKFITFIDNINPYLNSFIKGFEAFATPKALFMALFYSIIAWSGDCIFIYVLLIAFGIKANFIISFFIIGFISLSTVIPSTSIYVGLYQYAFILALGIFGIDKSPALSISIMQQGIMLFTYIVVTAIFMIKNQIKIQDIKEDSTIDNP